MKTDRDRLVEVMVAAFPTNFTSMSANKAMGIVADAIIADGWVRKESTFDHTDECKIWSHAHRELLWKPHPLCKCPCHKEGAGRER